MLSEYIQKALEKAQYRLLDDGTWFAEIPKFDGVWANARTVEEWIVLKIRDRDPIHRHAPC